MALSGKHKARLHQLRDLHGRFAASDPDRAVIGWAISILEGRLQLSNTSDPSIDTATPSILRWRTRYAEIRITDLLLTLDAIHNTCGCCCPGDCLLSDEWVPESVRRPAHAEPAPTGVTPRLASGPLTNTANCPNTTSANRSVDKMGAYLWMLDLDHDQFINAPYAQYGVPQLFVAAEQLGVTPPPDDEGLHRMAKGLPCEPDCPMGCSR